MTPELLFAFAVYAFVTSITPGPNNTMVLASGVNFGFRPSVPHIAGITGGFSFMVLAVGFGVGGIFLVLPQLYDVLRIAGAAYLLYLAWKIARSGPMEDGTAASRPFGFLQAAAFQWVNPKAWIMAIGAVTTYLPQEDFLRNIAVITLVYAIVNGPCVAAWAAFGAMMRRVLSRPSHVRLFNIVMALLLVLSLYPMLSALPHP